MPLWVWIAVQGLEVFREVGGLISYSPVFPPSQFLMEDEDEFFGLLDEMEGIEEDWAVGREGGREILDMDQFPDWDFPSDRSNVSSFTIPLLSPPSSPPPSEISVLTCIENIITSLTTTLTQAPSASSVGISLHSRRPQTTYFSPHTSSILPLPHTHPSSHFTSTTFPRNPRQFTCILTLLSILHAHHSSTLTPPPPPLTKRQIYYHNPTLFRTQRNVDHLLDSLAATFGLTRQDLGICAAGKGLVYGEVYIEGAYFGGEGGGLIPPSFAPESVILAAGVGSVLLVEKETIFRALSSLRSGIVQEGLVMLCGKGYPDLNTRRLLFLLREKKGVERAATLVDFDPDGVEIAATYKFGSTLLAHERVAARGVEVVGVLSQDLASLITSATAAAAASGGDGDGDGGGVVVTALTPRDRKKALALLTRPWMLTTPSWKVEVQRMLFWGIKCEVEAFYSGTCFARWVLRKVGKAVA